MRRRAVRVIHSVVSCARMRRPSRASTSSGPPVRGNAASSRNAPAEATPRCTLRRAAGESARFLRCRTRRRSAALALPPDRACRTSMGGSAQGESTGSVTCGTGRVATAFAPRAGGGGAACGTGAATAGSAVADSAAVPAPCMSMTVASGERSGAHAQQRDNAGHHAVAIVPRTRAAASLVRVTGRAVCSELARKCRSGGVVQSVRTPACHAGGRGFESRRSRSRFSLQGAETRMRLPRAGRSATPIQRAETPSRSLASC